MSDTTKTTVYLSADEYRRLKQLAIAEGRKAAELVREAVAEYMTARSSRKPPASIGAGHSGRKDLGERAEDMLKGFGERQ